MATLKRYSLPLLLLFITGVLLATMAWHHAHCRLKVSKLTSVQVPGIGMVTVGGEAPATSDATTWDWSLIGQSIGALMAGLVGVWQLIRKKDIAGAVAAGSQLITDAEKLRETLKAGAPLSTTETVLAAQLSVFMGHSEVTDLHRALAKDLLTKYVITVRP